MKKMIFFLLAVTITGCSNSGSPARDYNVDNTDNDDTALKPPPVIVPAIDSFTIDSIHQ